MSIWERLLGRERVRVPTMDKEVAAKLAHAKRLEAEAIESLADKEGNSDLKHLARTTRGEARLYESYYEEEEFDAITEEDGDR